MLSQWLQHRTSFQISALQMDMAKQGKYITNCIELGYLQKQKQIGVNSNGML